MKKVRILALAAVAALLLLFPAVVSAQPAPPHLTNLMVSLDGNPAPDGTEVKVMVDGAMVQVQVGAEMMDSVMTKGGMVALAIPGDAATSGKTISFMINGMDAAETDNWERGGHVDKNFSISAMGAMMPKPDEKPAMTDEEKMMAMKGEKGDKGDQGEKGDTGPKGDKGDTGGAGPKGDTGPAGADGAPGAPGEKGDKGDAGAPGQTGPAGADGGGGALGLVALILAIVALVGVAGAFVMGRSGS